MISDATGHTDGNHSVFSAAGGSCTYYDTGGDYCGVAVEAWIAPTTTKPTERGSTGAYSHDGHDNSNPGFAAGGGSAPATAIATLHATEESCLLGICLSGSFFKISFGPSTIWDTTVPYPIACGAIINPNPAPIYGGTIDPPTPDPCYNDEDPSDPCLKQTAKPHPSTAKPVPPRI